MIQSAVVFLSLGVVVGLAIGFYAGRSRATLAALMNLQVSAAAARAEHEIGDHDSAVSAMVAPVQEALRRVNEQLHRSERDRLAAAAALDEHLAAMRTTSEGLRAETAQLVTALRAPQVRGRWGELQLERAVEVSGMVAHVDYVKQATVHGPDGAQRPDLVVKLVGGRHIVVDAKVAFAGYLQAMEARDEATRKAGLRAHARQLRVHIDALGSKAYWSRFDSAPDFVVCFVPADVFLDAALQEEPGLLEHAFSRNVVLATPTTLVALLRTVGHVWRQDALARNTAAVSTLGRELHQRLGLLTVHLDKLGRSLGASVASFNAAVGTYEGRVLVSARKLAELGVSDEHTAAGLPAPEQILTLARSLGPHGQPGSVP
jgi:DNA recombination protein RmuC